MLKATPTHNAATSSLDAFRPFPMLGHPHLQTLFAAKFGFPQEAPSATLVIPLDDGDSLALRISTPPGWRPTDPTVVLVHGLCGCSRSPYLVRLAGRLYSRGTRAVRMNLRGCGEGEGLARQMYHSGRSADVLAVLTALKESEPTSRYSLVGFSLGGNIVLKLAGELATSDKDFVERVVAVCPPVDLLASSQRLSTPTGAIYDRYFCKLLRAAVRQRHRRFPDLPPPELPKRLTLFEFDDHYTAPQSGFVDAEDYYARSSALPLLASIVIPCHILYSADDPLIDVSALENAALPPSVCTHRTARGGHLGFLARPWSGSGYHWMDSRLIAWLSDRAEPHLPNDSVP
jgi:predicted alpha/beta-fold hydrolase